MGADFLYSVFKDCVDDVLRGKEGEAVAKRTRGRVERNAGVSKNDLKKKKKTIKEEENEEHVDFCIDGEKLAEAKEYKDKMVSYARDLEKNCIPVYSVDYWEEKKKKMNDGGVRNGGLSKCTICGKVVMLEYQGLHRQHCKEKKVEKSKSEDSSSSSSSSSSSESSSSESSSSSSSESESDSDEEGASAAAAGLKLQNQVKSRFYKPNSKIAPVSAVRPSMPASNGAKKQQQKRQASTARGGGGQKKKVAKVSSKPAVGVCAPMQNPMKGEMPRNMAGQGENPMFGQVYHAAPGNDAGMGRVPQQHVYGHYNTAFPQQQQMGAQGFATYGSTVPTMPYQNNAHQIANNTNLTPQQMQILAQYRYQQFLMQKQQGVAMGSPNLMVPQTGQYQVYGMQPNLHQPLPSSSAGSAVISGYNTMQQIPAYSPWQNLPRINVPTQTGMPANFIPQQPMDSMARLAGVTSTTTGYPCPTTSPMGIPPMFPGSGGQHSGPGAGPGDAWWEKQ